jgi:DNA-binding transcriptional LysR family regulator
MAVPFVIEPVVPTFRARHPRIEIEIVLEERFVDIVAESYDAGVRLSEAIERDMVQVRLTDSFRFVVVGAPAYLARHGTPERPEDLGSSSCGRRRWSACSSGTRRRFPASSSTFRASRAVRQPSRLFVEAAKELAGAERVDRGRSPGLMPRRTRDGPFRRTGLVVAHDSPA